MSVEIVTMLEKALHRQPPRWKVRCTLCGDEYITNCWRMDIVKRTGCITCVNRNKPQNRRRRSAA